MFECECVCVCVCLCVCVFASVNISIYYEDKDLVCVGPSCVTSALQLYCDACIQVQPITIKVGQKNNIMCLKGFICVCWRDLRS